MTRLHTLHDKLLESSSWLPAVIMAVNSSKSILPSASCMWKAMSSDLTWNERSKLDPCGPCSYIPLVLHSHLVNFCQDLLDVHVHIAAILLQCSVQLIA